MIQSEVGPPEFVPQDFRDHRAGLVMAGPPDQGRHQLRQTFLAPSHQHVMPIAPASGNAGRAPRRLIGSRHGPIRAPARPLFRRARPGQSRRRRSTSPPTRHGSSASARSCKQPSPWRSVPPNCPGRSHPVHDGRDDVRREAGLAAEGRGHALRAALAAELARLTMRRTSTGIRPSTSAAPEPRRTPRVTFGAGAA